MTDCAVPRQVIAACWLVLGVATDDLDIQYVHLYGLDRGLGGRG